jgi:alpha-tubulin suppressor-like RCC1 family protein/serine/threonine protein kinase
MNDEREAGEISDLEDEYTLLGELGRGGSAIVYRARDHVLNRDVAIKVVRPKFAANADEAIERLTREARTVARLQHPSIVTVHAVKRLRDGGLALVMQMVPGRTLKQAIQADGPFDPARAEMVLRDVASALAFAHSKGVVHRDVKPENIFLEVDTGRALLSDFGIAHSSEFDSRLTMTGAAIGTPAYMAPEQIDGAPANARSDLYSLGLVAWEMLTGERPWEGEALYNVIFKQKNEQLPAIDSLRPGEVPPRLQYIVERMLQKKPTARWAGADGLLAALNNWVVPSDWRQWEESHRRRREAERVSPRSKPAFREDPANATVRFARPAEGVAPSPVPGGEEPADVAPAAAVMEPEDEVPSWGEAPVPSSRRWMWVTVGVLALVVAGGAFAMYAKRGGLVGAREDRPNMLADAPAIELPLVQPVLADSASDLSDTTTATAIDTSRDPVSFKLLMDSLRADSARVDSIAAGALRREQRRAARAAEESANPGAAPKGTGGSNPGSPVGGSTAGFPTAAVEPAVPSIRATDDPGIVSAGGRHSCALIDSKAYCWGSNDRGQLGDGEGESRDAPVPVVGDLTFSQLTTGVGHTCGVTRGGEAYCWGANDRGQLGDATTTARSAPVRVAGSQAYRVLRAGQYHTCGLTTGGDVYCWGANSNGQVGDGGTSTRSSPVSVGGGVRFVSISAGWSHTCGIIYDGSVYCWGANAGGQLGNGTRADARSPSLVASPLRFTSVAAGSNHTCAVSEIGDVYCWGKNQYGQLGTGGTSDQNVPTRVESSARLVSVTVGSVHTCARSRSGQGWCWGRNYYGQLGDGTTSNRDVPTRVVGTATFTSMNATGAHTCATATDGETSCWGYNVEGQLGDGSRNHNPRPTRVVFRGR